MNAIPDHVRLSNMFARAGLNGRKNGQRGYTIHDGDFFTGLRAGMRRRGHRLDLKVSRAPYRAAGRVCVDVAFNPGLGDPPFEHLQAAVAREYPDREIVHQGGLPVVDVLDESHGVLRVALQMHEERIPVASPDRIPEGFAHIGSGVFRKADGSDHHVWHMERDEAGKFALVRKVDEHPVTPDDFARIAAAVPATAQRPKVGQEVQVPEGSGRFVALNAAGHAIIDINGRHFTYHLAQVVPTSVEGDPGLPPSQRTEGGGNWNAGKEQAWVKDYYAKMFGNESFAGELTREYARA